MRGFQWASVLAALLVWGCASAPEAPPAPAAAAPAVVSPPPPPPEGYADPARWLCLPGRANDACAADQSAAIVAADGGVTVEPFAPKADAPIDCFYVYPTVSNDPGGNSDWQAGLEELSVVQQQAARFQQVCKVYAPLYRQVTLTALIERLQGKKSDADAALAYRDVAEAWAHYLKHHNNGRGVILIGHSQGARLLAQLTAAEVAGKPAQAQLIAAYLIGTNISFPTPKSKAAGDLGAIPACAAKDQLGCAVSYVSFRREIPPPKSSRFGRVEGAGLEALCVNPAQLLGRKSLGSYLPTRASPSGGGGGEYPVWSAKTPEIAQPFVKTPGLLEGACVRKNGFSYLEVVTQADPRDPRTDRIPGDVVVGGQVSADWGLHVVDMHLAMGDLVALAEAQGAAWAARRP